MLLACMDITNFMVGNHYCCEFYILLHSLGHCFASFVQWLWHCPSTGIVVVDGWGGGGGGLGCMEHAGEVDEHATTLWQ